jgi:hypothetical protein
VFGQFVPERAVKRRVGGLPQQGAKTVPEPELGALQLELWNYSPALVTDTSLVDPLSLILSLQSDADDRVQQALDAIEERLSW